MDAAEVEKNRQGLIAAYPGAEVISSTLDDFVTAVKEDGAEASLPVIEDELSDTWIFGIGSDPVKTMKTRAINRARTACEEVRHAVITS